MHHTVDTAEYIREEEFVLIIGVKRIPFMLLITKILNFFVDFEVWIF